MKNIRTFGLILASVALLSFGFGGCSSGGDSGGDDPTPEIPLSDTTISGSAVDGYLVYATVCLDLSEDGYCQLGTEPATSTDKNGSFSLTLTVEQQSHANYDTAPLLVYGGYDADTNADFTGKLKAPFSAQAITNITPITTMIEAMVQEGQSEAEAEDSVQEMLGIEDGTDLSADPVELAKTNPDLLRAALQLQKTMEMLAEALKKVDTTGTSQNDLVEGLYANLADKLKTARAGSGATSLDVMIGAVVDNTDNLDAEDKNGALAISTQIEIIVGTGAVQNTALIGTQVGAVKNEVVVAVVDGGGNILGLDLNATASKAFSLLHAEEILRIIDTNTTNFDALASSVQSVLLTAGMSETAFLAIEDEIAILQASTIAEVQLVGTELEIIFFGYTENVDSASNPFIGSWTIADNTALQDLEINLVILSNTHYYIAQGEVGDEGIVGGIELGTYTYANNIMVTNYYDELIINTNAHDTIARDRNESGNDTISYNPTDDTITFSNTVDNTSLTLTRNEVLDKPEVGAWSVLYNNQMIALLTLDKSGKYMISGIDLEHNSVYRTSEYTLSNAFEMGTYVVNGDIITFTINTAKDFNEYAGFNDDSDGDINVETFTFSLDTEQRNITVSNSSGTSPYSFSKIQADNINIYYPAVVFDYETYFVGTKYFASSLATGYRTFTGSTYSGSITNLDNNYTFDVSGNISSTSSTLQLARTLSGTTTLTIPDDLIFTHIRSTQEGKCEQFSLSISFNTQGTSQSTVSTMCDTALDRDTFTSSMSTDWLDGRTIYYPYPDVTDVDGDGDTTELVVTSNSYDMRNFVHNIDFGADGVVEIPEIDVRVEDGNIVQYDDIGLAMYELLSINGTQLTSQRTIVATGAVSTFYSFTTAQACQFSIDNP